LGKQYSAGILLFRRHKADWEFYLGHPGGPFFRRRDEGWWSIPKGRVEKGEEELATAEREFREETGFDAPPGKRLDLGQVKQKGGKVIRAFAVEFPPGAEVPPLNSNTYPLIWPPKSGQTVMFPEFDKAQFFPESEARKKINAAQCEFINRVKELFG